MTPFDPLRPLDPAAAHRQLTEYQRTLKRAGWPAPATIVCDSHDESQCHGWCRVLTQQQLLLDVWGHPSQGLRTRGRAAHAPVSNSVQQTSRRTAQSCRFRAALTAFLCVEPDLFRRLDASFAEMKACKRYRRAVTCYVC